MFAEIRAAILRKIGRLMVWREKQVLHFVQDDKALVEIRGLWLVHLADEAFQVFGFGEVEEDGMVLGCSAAFEQSYAAVSIDGG